MENRLENRLFSEAGGAHLNPLTFHSLSFPGDLTQAHGFQNSSSEPLASPLYQSIRWVLELRRETGPMFPSV